LARQDLACQAFAACSSPGPIQDNKNRVPSAIRMFESGSTFRIRGGVGPLRAHDRSATSCLCLSCHTLPQKFDPPPHVPYSPLAFRWPATHMTWYWSLSTYPHSSQFQMPLRDSHCGHISALGSCSSSSFAISLRSASDGFPALLVYQIRGFHFHDRVITDPAPSPISVWAWYPKRASNAVPPPATSGARKGSRFSLFP